jgi:hypothetical protein
MPRVVFEHTAPASARVKTVYALDRSATVTGINGNKKSNNKQTRKQICCYNILLERLFSLSRKSGCVAIYVFFCFSTRFFSLSVFLAQRHYLSRFSPSPSDRPHSLSVSRVSSCPCRKQIHVVISLDYDVV